MIVPDFINNFWQACKIQNNVNINFHYNTNLFYGCHHNDFKRKFFQSNFKHSSTLHIHQQLMISTMYKADSRMKSFLRSLTVIKLQTI